MNNYIIDRFEGAFAICEDENSSFIKIPKENLPQQCKEGDCITDSNGIYFIDNDNTELKKKRIQKKMNELFE